jgi:type I restriction enzyme, S subunit
MSSVVPEGWSKLVMGNIGTFSTSSVDKKLKDGETHVSLLNYMDIYRNSVLSSSYPFQSVTAPAKQVISSSVKNGDVFFTPSSETPEDIGHSAVFIGDAECLVHSYHTIRFRPVENNYFDDNYKAFAFRGEATYEYFRKRATGSTRFTVSLPIFNELEVLCPPLPEQKKIASILTSVDEVIENTQKQIDKLEDLKKATMNELLTKGIGHTEFKDSELGRIPKSWEVGALSNLADFTSGFAFSSSDFSETGLLCIRMGNLYNNEFNPFRSPQYLPSEFASQHPRFVVTARNLLISMTGTAGKEDYGFVVEVPNEFNQGLLNQRVGKVIPKNQDAKAFIRELMRSRLYLEQLFSFGSGTKQANLSQSQIMGISIPIPPIDEQRRIGETVSNVSDTINALSRKLSQTQSLKKSLMQDLLTGKVRVTVN